LSISLLVAVSLTEIEKARKIGERALKSISFRAPQEKLNVWVALLNLENMYGSAKSMADTFTRATQYNDPLTIFMEVAKIYAATKKIEVRHDTTKLRWAFPFSFFSFLSFFFLLCVWVFVLMINFYDFSKLIVPALSRRKRLRIISLLTTKPPHTFDLFPTILLCARSWCRSLFSPASLSVVLLYVLHHTPPSPSNASRRTRPR
jgi:hypothetical protein